MFAWFRHSMNKEPALMGSAVAGGIALFVPLCVPPMRKAYGAPTDQYYLSTENPEIHRYEDRADSSPDFEDEDLIIQYSKDTPYRTDAQPVNSNGRPREEYLTDFQWGVKTGFWVPDPNVEKAKEEAKKKASRVSGR